MPGRDDHARYLELLTTVSYFEGLNDDLLLTIAASMIKRTYEPGEIVFFEGDSSHSLHIIEEGYLKAVKSSAEGREQVLQIIGPREVFGAVAVFHAAINPATLIALERTTVYSIEREEMHRLLAASSELAARVIDNLAGRVLHLIKLVEDLSLRSVEGRLARMLAEQHEDGLLTRRKWTTQAEMAARLGTVPDVLGRALHKLVEEGLIELDRHQIKILDLEKLEERAMIEI
jgi:CRP/FNR family transcriptional regulator